MMRQTTSAALLFVIATVLFATVASASDIDQQQPGIDTGGSWAIGGGSQQRLAQVVTAGRTGSLVELRLPVLCSSGNLIVEIQGVAAGQPNGIVLTSQTISGASLPPFFPDPPSFRSLAFAVPVSVNSGDAFAFVLSSAGVCGIFQGPIGDPYLGGAAYFDASPNQAGVWVPLGERSDLPFQTVVELQVAIDIKPSGTPNTISTRSMGKIPVAILSSLNFNAPANVNPSSLTFGRIGTEASLFNCDAAASDVNGDGLLDFVCRFDTPTAGFVHGDTVGVLRGRTFDDIPIRGTDSVNIIP